MESTTVTATPPSEREEATPSGSLAGFVGRGYSVMRWPSAVASSSAATVAPALRRSAREAGWQAPHARAADLAAIVKELRAADARSLRAIPTGTPDLKRSLIGSGYSVTN
jgi:hypothetical protein